MSRYTDRASAFEALHDAARAFLATYDAGRPIEAPVTVLRDVLPEAALHLQMTAVRLREAGEFLHGSRWQTALSRQLGCHARTIKRWAEGDYEVPMEEAQRILALVREKAERFIER